MAHRSRIDKIVIDLPEAGHDRALAFWRAATGGPSDRSLDDTRSTTGLRLPGQEIAMLVQRLGDGTAGRVHLDIHTDDLDAEVARLEALGAERVRQVHGWWIMRDPAGLPFCVIPDEPGRLTDDNAQPLGLTGAAPRGGLVRVRTRPAGVASSSARRPVSARRRARRPPRRRGWP